MSETRHKINKVNDLFEIEDLRADCWRARAKYNHNVLYCADLIFHTGEGLPNGLTNEVLLAIVAARIEAWQKGPHTCRENALALTKIEEALHWLGARAKREGEAP